VDATPICPASCSQLASNAGDIRRLAKGADLSNNTAPKWISWKTVDSKGDPP
jgi:hypothetical protein